MRFKSIAPHKCVFSFVAMILLFGTSVDEGIFSSFALLDDTPRFTSSSLDKKKWSSMTREYCFLKKELFFELVYEFSPMPLPAFKITNSISDIYISVDIDEISSLRFQKLIGIWKDVSKLEMNEKLCFVGSYLPADNPKDATSIIIDEIKSKNLKLVVKDFLLEESDLD